MWFFVIIVVLVSTLIIPNLVSLVAFKRRLDFAKTIPGPNFFELLENVKKGRVLQWLKECTHKHGSFFRVWFGLDLTIFFTNPDDIKIILSSNELTTKSRNYDLLRPWLGNGLLTNGGIDWHHKRKLLTPAFHFKILGTFKGPMEECCNILIDQLNKVADGRIIDVSPYITLFALDVICETAMGIKVEAQTTESNFVRSTKLICKLLHKQSFTPWQRIPFLFNLSPAGRRTNSALAVLHSSTRNVIELRKSQMNDWKDDEGVLEVDGFEGKRRMAFLDSLLIAQRDGVPLTDQNIQEEVDTFMFEGHDTTSSAISFAIYLLSRHASLQTRAYEEAQQCIDKESQPMPFLEAVIKETLRLYPAVPFYSRRAVEPFQVGNVTVPVGANISILTYVIHRNETIYPEPEKFKPERFLDDSYMHPFAHVAFSAGPRNCIGQKFAMLELKCTISKLLRTFEILPVNEFEPLVVPELVLKSGNGIQVRLRKRE